MRSFLATFLSTVVVVPVAAGDLKETHEWPGWRGPTRDGRVHPNEPAWPLSLEGDTLSRSWEVKLGPSYSGPVVTDDRVFVTETVDKQREVVSAFSRVTGKRIWSTEWNGSLEVPFFASKNGSWIRSTPAYDGERLYVAGIRDLLVCLDARDGKELWRRDFVKEFDAPPPAFGFVCSPLVVGPHVYVQAGAAFVKLEGKTGKVLWKTLEDGGGMYGSAFSSPAHAKILGKKQLVVQTRTKLAGIDPTDGAVLWSTPVPAFRGMNILTPAIAGNRVFTSTYGGGTRVFDIERSRTEEPEGQNGLRGTEFQVREIWKDGAQGYMSSPILAGGHAYLHLRNRRIACFDLSEGTKTWTTQERFGEYMSMVLHRDLIVALDASGTLLLLRANPKQFEILSRREVNESPTWAHLAVVDGDVFVRSLDGLTVYRWQGHQGRPTGTAGLPR